MKMQKHHERGQALILIALAVVGLIGFTALSIDGSSVFSDRRHSQNASDTAVTAAALERVRRPDENWKVVAQNRALDNGYDDSDPETEVNVHLCSETGLTTEDGVALVCSNLPDGADPSAYVHVHIKSVVHLFFAPILGWRTVTNHTDAIAWAKPSVPTNYFDGYGIASLHEGCNNPGEGDPFELGGSGNSQVVGAGVLVNASCATDQSFVQNGNPTLHTSTGVCVHGTASWDPGEITSDASPALEEGCPPVDPNSYVAPPAPDCSTAGQLSSLGGGVYLAIPGYFNSEFPGTSGSATIKLGKGVYCFNEGMKLNSQTSITTDVNENGSFDPSFEGVLFYLPGIDSGDEITFNGGSSVNLHAISIAPINLDWDEAWLNMLIYVNPDYDPDIDISGNSGSTFTGTIYAPSAHVHLLGNNGTSAGTVTLDSQIIADTVQISGDTDFVLVYNESNNATTITPPSISMIE